MTHGYLNGEGPEGALLGGRYRLESRIGSGGMGVVYRATDETLGRTVAIKLFREPAAADLGRKTSETRLLAALNHPSLVTLYDARIDGDADAYLVMEYVDGPTLRARISDGPVAPVDAARMARDLGEALHVVHDAGVVHRDIKPANVLLRRSLTPGEEFTATLADFGIAHLIGSSRLTTPGTLLGTAAYLSPEQVRGAEPAPPSDIYSLGLVLLESLTGERAFAQPGVHEAALARLTQSPAVPGSLGYGWKSLLTAMTASDPQERPTAMEVVTASRGLSSETAAQVETTTAETGALPAVAAIAATQAMPATGLTAETLAPTRQLPDSSAPTAVFDTPGTPRRLRAPRRSRRLVVLLAGVGAAVLLSGVLVWSLWAAPGSSSTSVPSPATTGIQPESTVDPVPASDTTVSDVPPTAEPAPEPQPAVTSDPVVPPAPGNNGNDKGDKGNNGKGNGKNK